MDSHPSKALITAGSNALQLAETAVNIVASKSMIILGLSNHDRDKRAAELQACRRCLMAIVQLARTMSIEKAVIGQ